MLLNQVLDLFAAVENDGISYLLDLEALVAVAVDEELVLRSDEMDFR